MARITLRHRFWLISLAFLILALVLPTLLLATVVTPPVVERLVRLDEEKRLNDLRNDMEALPPGVRLVDKSQVLPQQIAVPLSPTQWLVSDRQPNLKQALMVVRPAPWRGFFGLLVWVAFLYFLATLLARFVNKPIKDLREGVRALSQGRREVTVKVPAERELAELAQGFNEMAAQLAQGERDLELALQAKERMFASTSHELRTPLTVILGYTQMLQDGLKGELSPEQQESMQVIHRNAEGLLYQVEVLLTNSQLKAGTLPLALESVDLRDLVDQLVLELSPFALGKGLRLEASLPDFEVLSQIDYRHGRQVVRNLLENAIKFTSQGSVEVQVLKNEAWVEVRVKDTGPGVQVAFEERLFQEFSRGPNSEGIEGSGLGLALSQGLAQRMGGEIKLLENSEKGAVFAWRQAATEQ